MKIILLLDFDGTLVNIAQTPGKVRVKKDLLNLLDGVSKIPFVTAGIVTGRTLESIKRLLPLKKLLFAGNHGLEMQLPGTKIINKAKKYNAIINHIAKEMEKQSVNIPGALLENKGSTLSLHYRMANKKNAEKIEKLFFTVAGKYLEKNNLEVLRGKKVFELKPKINWDKGKAVLWLAGKIQNAAKDKMLAVYIGDDVTDESAFETVNSLGGISIFVGFGKITSASKKVKNPEAVIKILKELLSINKTKRGRNEKDIQSERSLQLFNEV